MGHIGVSCTLMMMKNNQARNPINNRSRDLTDEMCNHVEKREEFMYLKEECPPTHSKVGWVLIWTTFVGVLLRIPNLSRVFIPI